MDEYWVLSGFTSNDDGWDRMVFWNQMKMENDTETSSSFVDSGSALVRRRTRRESCFRMSRPSWWASSSTRPPRPSSVTSPPSSACVRRNPSPGVGCRSSCHRWSYSSDREWCWSWWLSAAFRPRASSARCTSSASWSPSPCGRPGCNWAGGSRSWRGLCSSTTSSILPPLTWLRCPSPKIFGIDASTTDTSTLTLLSFWKGKKFVLFIIVIIYIVIIYIVIIISIVIVVITVIVIIIIIINPTFHSPMIHSLTSYSMSTTRSETFRSLKKRSHVESSKRQELRNVVVIVRILTKSTSGNAQTRHENRPLPLEGGDCLESRHGFIFFVKFDGFSRVFRVSTWYDV